MEKILAGTYTIEEYIEIVNQWREVYCVNKLAVYPDPLKVRFIENMSVTVENGQVILKEIV